MTTTHDIVQKLWSVRDVLRRQSSVRPMRARDEALDYVGSRARVMAEDHGMTEEIGGAARRRTDFP